MVRVFVNGIPVHESSYGSTLTATRPDYGYDKYGEYGYLPKSAAWYTYNEDDFISNFEYLLNMDKENFMARFDPDEVDVQAALVDEIEDRLDAEGIQYRLSWDGRGNRIYKVRDGY